jgi:hypothetical protein
MKVEHGVVDWQEIDEGIIDVPEEFREPRFYPLKHVVEIFSSDDPQGLTAEVGLACRGTLPQVTLRARSHANSPRHAPTAGRISRTRALPPPISRPSPPPGAGGGAPAPPPPPPPPRPPPRPPPPGRGGGGGGVATHVYVCLVVCLGGRGLTRVTGVTGGWAQPRPYPSPCQRAPPKHAPSTPCGRWQGHRSRCRMRPRPRISP